MLDVLAASSLEELAADGVGGVLEVEGRREWRRFEDELEEC